jgi:hypothetical protein
MVAIADRDLMELHLKVLKEGRASKTSLSNFDTKGADRFTSAVAVGLQLLLWSPKVEIIDFAHAGRTHGHW